MTVKLLFWRFLDHANSRCGMENSGRVFRAFVFRLQSYVKDTRHSVRGVITNIYKIEF